MKKKVLAFIAIGLLIATYAHGCPTCIGRLRKSDEPFFSDGYYRNIQTTLDTGDQYSGLIDESDIGDDDDTENDTQ